jgi:hypothetical protein
VLSASEIESRLPVWHALSDLFLDTELQAEDYRRIGAALRASGFGREALRTILEDEVAPAFMFNLLDLAGEWLSWDPDEVREIMLRQLRSGAGRPRLSWLKKRIHRRHISEEWAKLEALLSDG